MGYRQSSFDPNAAWGEPGKPLRPYNWVQWTGVGFIVLGLLGFLAEIVARIGWISGLDGDAAPFAPFASLGVLLIYSRRHPDRPIEPEIMRRRRFRLIVVLVTAVAFGAAIVLLEANR